MIPRDLHFLFPSAAILLLGLIPLCILFLYGEIKRRNALEKLAPLQILSQSAKIRDPKRVGLKFLALALSWILACLALMWPIGRAHYSESLGQESVSSKLDIIFLIDTSESMAVKDMRTQISRLEYVKELGDQIAKQLAGNNLTLITFTTNNFVAVPLTLDDTFFRLRLKDLSLNEGDAPPGTDFLSTFSELKNFYSFDPQTTYQTLIVFSDGEDLVSNKNELLSSLKKSISDFPNLQILTVGLGTLSGGVVPGIQPQVVSRLDAPFLQTLSQEGRGQFFLANDDSVEDLADKVVKAIREREKKIPATQAHLNSQTIIYQEYFQVPLLLSLLALLFAYFLPEVTKKTLCILILLFPMSVFTSELFQAEQSYEAGNYKDAIDIYLELLNTSSKREQKPLILYNLATSYLANNQLDEAISELREILQEEDFLPETVKKRAHFNLALAFLKKAHLSSNAFQRFYDLRLALYHAKRASAVRLLGVVTAELDSSPPVTFEGVDEGSLKPLSELYRQEAMNPYLEDLDFDYLFNYQSEIIKQFAEDAKTLEKAGDFLREAKELYKNKKRLQARLFLMEAHLEVEALLQKGDQPILKLAHLIDTAESSLVLDQLFKRHPEELKEFEKLRSQVREKTLNQIKAFPDVVSAWQKKQFEAGNCQCLPWNEALPLFFRGWDLFESEPHTSIKLWKKALELIKNLPLGKNRDSSAQEELKNETLRALQEMQQLDRLPAREKPAAQGGKRW